MSGSIRLPILARLLLTSSISGLAVFLSGCQSTPQLSVAWDPLPSYASVAPKEAQICFVWKDAAGAPEFEFLKDELVEASKRRGLAVVDEEKDAQYICMCTLRYFNQNSNADGGRSVQDVAGDAIAGGYKNWIEDGQGTTTELPHSGSVPAVDDKGTVLGKFTRADEWVLLIDFAIGEREGAQASDYTRREGRLVAFTSKGSMSREEAVAELKERVRASVTQVLPR